MATQCDTFCRVVHSAIWRRWKKVGSSTESLWIQARNTEPAAYRPLQSRVKVAVPPGSSLADTVQFHFLKPNRSRIPQWRHHESIARWAGCLCPCATQTEPSPCPSAGPSWDPRGCRASAPRPRTSAARASTPAGSWRGPRHSRLRGAHKTRSEWKSIWTLYIQTVFCIFKGE